MDKLMASGIFRSSAEHFFLPFPFPGIFFICIPGYNITVIAFLGKKGEEEGFPHILRTGMMY